MKTIASIFAVAIVLAVVFPALAGHEKPKCADGEKWDHDTQSCIPDPKG